MPTTIDKTVRPVYGSSSDVTVYGNGYVESSSSSPVYGPYEMSKQTRSWVRTPGYRALRKTGTLPDNPYSFEIQKTGDETYTASSMGTNPGASGWDVRSRTIIVKKPMAYLGTPEVPSLTTSSELATKLLDAAKGNQFNVPIFLAEAGKTAEMVYTRATHLVSLLRNLRRGNVSAFFDGLYVTKERYSRRQKRLERTFNRDFGRDATTAAANLWLETTYGWVPFMMDVRNAVNATMDAVELQGENHVGKVKSTVRRDTTIVTEGFQMEVSPGITGRVTQVVSESRRGVWRFRPNPLDLPARFGLVNPLEVVWELVPFSFVADWFLPIGDYLSSLDAPLRFIHVGGTWGFRKSVATTLIANGSGYWQKVSGSQSRTFVTVSRSKMNDIPVPSISEMRLSADLGAKRVLSSIALLHQNIRRVLPRDIRTYTE